MDRARYTADPERYRAAARVQIAKDRPRHRANTKAWLLANPKRARANSRAGTARRRARIASVLATLTAAEWDAILEAAGRACIYCGSRKRLTQDHLIPISRSGNHTAENVAPACLPCNQSKGAQVVVEFLAERRS